jgi:hypothetical protein
LEPHLNSSRARLGYYGTGRFGLAGRATLPSLRRHCAAQCGSPAHEDPPTDRAGQGRPQGEHLRRGLCSPYAPAPHRHMKRGRSSAAGMPRRGTRLLAGWTRAARPARPLRRRMGNGALEELRSQHWLRGRCRGPSRRAAVSGAGRGECAGLLASEAGRGMQTMDPWRVGHQGERVVNVCTRVCRSHVENGR